MFGIQKLGRPRRQDQPHAGALPDLRGDHGVDPLADFQRVAPQPARHGRCVFDGRHFVAGVCDPGGAIRVFAVPVREDREPASQDRRGLGRAP